MEFTRETANTLDALSRMLDPSYDDEQLTNTRCYVALISGDRNLDRAVYDQMAALISMARTLTPPLSQAAILLHIQAEHAHILLTEAVL